jgi:hypothetical protein
LLRLLHTLGIVIGLHALALVTRCGKPGFLNRLSLPRLSLLRSLTRFLHRTRLVGSLLPGLDGTDFIGALHFPRLLHLLKLGLNRGLRAIPNVLLGLGRLTVLAGTLGLLAFLHALGLRYLLRLTCLLRRSLLQFLQNLTRRCGIIPI